MPICSDMPATSFLSLSPRRLDVSVEAVTGGYRLSLELVGIDRVDVAVDGRPRMSVDVSDGITEIRVDAERESSAGMEISGFRSGSLVARRLLPLVHVSARVQT